MTLSMETPENPGAPPQTSQGPSSQLMAQWARDALDSCKAQDILVLDVRGRSSFTDFMVIASGTSGRHVDALAEGVCSSLADRGIKSIALEGRPLCAWVVVDFGDVVVHIFKPEVRRLYQLEEMWAFDTATPSY